MNGMDKKIAIVGIGGVGGYLGGMLARTYPHVTFVARGERGEAIRANGLVLHSDHNGEICVHPESVVASAQELEEQDILFLCVKNYSLRKACEECRNAVGENTIVVPVMNGVDVGEKVSRFLGRGLLVDSLIYIVAFVNEDYSVSQQGDYGYLRIGLKNPDVETGRTRRKEAVSQVGELFDGAGIDYKISQDIESEIWKKYILNCAYNVSTAHYNNTIGELRSDPVKAKEFESLAWEAWRVADTKGIDVSRRDVEAIIKRFYEELADGATSSLQRDLWQGKPVEIETFSGYLVKEAARLGVDVPVSSRMYEGLKKIASVMRTYAGT